MQRLNVEFRSEGVALRGWLYLPEARAERPAIVMTHGFSGVKEQYLDRYAEVFAAAGFVVLLYDHPNFGDSDGEPRQEIDPVMQRRGYRDAITWLGAQARSTPAASASGEPATAADMCWKWPHWIGG